MALFPESGSVWGPIIYLSFAKIRIQRRPNKASCRQTSEDEMRSALTWCGILAGVCMAAPYVLGVRPRTPRDRFYIALTLAFLAWILGLMISVRSR